MDNKEISLFSDAKIENNENDESSYPQQQCTSDEVMVEIYEMRSNNQLCDAVLHCLVDDTYVNVHRIMLSACSKYFK